MRYHIITYGCQMNKSDSERIATVLENCGYNPVSKENEADLIVVNMCSVRQSAVDRVYGKIKDFAKLKTMPRTETKFLVRGQNSPKESLRLPTGQAKLKTLLTGCILKKDKQNFAKMFDFILDIKDLPKLSKLLKTRSCKSEIKNYLDVQPKYQNNFSAFIPVSNGCNNFCTYCVVPYTRGPLVCRNHREILKEVKNMVQRGFYPPTKRALVPLAPKCKACTYYGVGVKEIWLLGQNVNRYRSISKTNIQNPKVINFAKLLKMVNNIPGDFWIRFTSPHPKDFSDELIRAMAESEKFAHYLNLPVQSGNNEILKKMNRPYTIAHYKKLVKKIRKAIPDIAVSTDVIVGFPTETKKQFQDTVELFKEIKYDMAYIAKYSPRPGTAAVKMKDNVSEEEKEKRWKVLTEILKKTALKKNKKYIGKKIDVLVDGSKFIDNKKIFFGKTRTYKTVKILDSKSKIPAPDLVLGQFIKIKIINAFPWGLRGKII